MDKISWSPIIIPATFLNPGPNTVKMVIRNEVAQGNKKKGGGETKRLGKLIFA